MPYVNIKITPDGITTEKKAILVRAVTDLLVQELDKDPALTFVVIDVVETEDWGVAGELTSRRRARLQNSLTGEPSASSTAGELPCG